MRKQCVQNIYRKFNNALKNVPKIANFWQEGAGYSYRYVLLPKDTWKLFGLTSGWIAGIYTGNGAVANANELRWKARVCEIYIDGLHTKADAMRLADEELQRRGWILADEDIRNV
jgi:hypothetical protein